MEAWADSCLICGQKFYSQSEMAEHVKSHTGAKDTDVMTDDKSIDCPFCHFKHEDASEIEIHVLTAHSDEISTPKKEKSETENSLACNDTERAGSSDEQVLANVGNCNNVSSFTCPVCNAQDFSSIEALNSHVELHFISDSGENESNVTSPTLSDELLAVRMQHHENYAQTSKSLDLAEKLHFEQLKDQYGMGEKHKQKGYRKQAFSTMEKEVGRGRMNTFDYYNKKLTMLERLEKGIDDGFTLTPGILEFIKSHFVQISNSKSHVWLAATTDHLGRGPGDSGWGCGYRNIQMMLSCLNRHPAYVGTMKSALNNTIPSIPKIQNMIEAAWSDGYDPRGREQLESKLSGTRKWIGATEVFTLLASLKFHCRIVDFPKYSGQNKSHPLLFEWIQKYFQTSGQENTLNNVTLTERPPLYLQHDGHSRTIVGIIGECKKDSEFADPVKYIQFDPGHSQDQIWRNSSKKKNTKHKASSHPNLDLFVKPVFSLKHSQYQIVCVEGIASEERTIKQKNVDAIAEKVQ